MDVRLSAEQQALRDAVGQLVARLGPQTVRDLEDTERADKLDAAVDGTGWRGLRATGDDGGPLASAVEAALVAEALARGAADTSFIGPTLAMDLRRRAGASSDVPAETVAFGADLAHLAHMTHIGDGGAVAVDVGSTRSALLLAGSPDSPSLGWANVGAPVTQVDLTRTVALIDASSVAPLPDQLRALTRDDLAAWTALGLALTSADLVGTMHGAIELACGHARMRRQYDAAIGSFQAIQHLLADAHVLTEGARSATLHAAWAVDALAPAEALGAAAVAKAYAARAARTVGETVVQVHGGIGNTWECMAHVYVRRALVSTDLFGGVGASLARVLEHHGIGSAHGLR